MPYENFTTYTEVDPNSDITLTSDTCSFDTLDNGTNAWVYKDKGVDYFDGDIEHTLEVKITGQTGGYGRAIIWSLTNTITDFKSCSDGLGVAFDNFGENRYVRLYERNGASEYSDITASSFYSEGTSYYLTIKRDETIGTYGRLYCYIYSDFARTNLLDTLQLDLHEKVDFRYVFCLQRLGGTGSGSTYTGYTKNLNIPIPEYLGADTLTLSDEIKIQPRPQRIYLEDTINLSDNLFDEFKDSDTISLSDEIDLLFSLELEDILSIDDEITIATIELVRSDVYNKFGMVNGILSDIENKTGFIGRNLSDVNNKIGFLKSWQVAGDAGYQSLGKTYVKVYINTVEQTDIDVDSITISKILNGSHTASFTLGRPYDNTKPSMESEIEIKYHIWTLYKGYITQINPGDRPDSIKIICQDEYWKRNKIKKYFFVGHKPQDNHELFYNRISTALSTELGWNPGIGDFIPQTMNCFGTRESDCINNLINNSGNYKWFYCVNKSDATISKKLWTAGQGDIINLEKQEIGKNLGLYQVLAHSFRDSVEGIVNKFRVQMGNFVIRRFNDSGGNKEYSSYRYEHFYGSASSGWDSTYERLAKDSPDGYGVFYHPVSQNELYKDVFTTYSLPSLLSDLESWTDAFPPVVQVLIPFGFWKCSLGTEGYLTEGFTIDYENGLLIFNEPIYLYQTNENGEMINIRRPEISLQLWKRTYYSNTENPSDNPATDVSNPLMFFTDKMGDYSDTIMDNLELGGLGIQIGGWYISGYTEQYTYVPSWNDTKFAKDFANWQLSKKCDKKINGNIEVAIDTICFYDIDLSKRIMIDGVIENPLNIESITLNIGSWRASIGLQNNRYYKRDISFQNHGV